MGKAWHRETLALMRRLQAACYADTPVCADERRYVAYSDFRRHAAYDEVRRYMPMLKGCAAYADALNYAHMPLTPTYTVSCFVSCHELNMSS